MVKTKTRSKPAGRKANIKAVPAKASKAKAAKAPKAKAAKAPKAKATRKAKAAKASIRKPKKQKALKQQKTSKKVQAKKAQAKTMQAKKAQAQQQEELKALKKKRRKPATAKVKTRRAASAPRREAREDSNTLSLPTLDLERYEPHVKEEAGVADSAKGSTIFGWIGAGQCGGRLVKSFYDLGYRKVVAINTTHHDLDLLDIPRKQKFLMDIGEEGAGKDMNRGREATRQYQQDIYHLVEQVFATQVNRIMVCAGAGGGTGSGSATELVEIAKRYARQIGIPNPEKRVGVLLTLPTVGEASSPVVSENAYNTALDLGKMAMKGKISPLIIVDNDKISRLYPGATVRSFWPTINNTVAGLFDIFNRLSALSSRYSSFDPMDYNSIMDSGGCTIMGLTKVTQFKDKYSLSKAVKANLEKTLLANGFDLTTAKTVGCIVVGGKKLMTSEQGLQDNINYAFDVLSGITGKATVHRGIYDDARESLRVYTIIGGLEPPSRRLKELATR